MFIIHFIENIILVKSGFLNSKQKVWHRMTFSPFNQLWNVGD